MNEKQKKNRLECLIRTYIYVPINSGKCPNECYWQIVGFAQMAGLSLEDFKRIPKGTLLRIAEKHPPRYWKTKNCAPWDLEGCEYHNCDVCGAWKPGIKFRMEILNIATLLKIWKKKQRFMKKQEREHKKAHQEYLIWQKQLDERIKGK